MDTECRIITDPNIPKFMDCFYFEAKGKKYASFCYKLIEEINEKNDGTTKIGLYETRHHVTGDYDCCWYLGFINHKKEFHVILRFEIWESKIFTLFQSVENVPKEVLEHWGKVDSNNWVRAPYPDEKITKELLVKYLVRYLKNVNKNWKKVTAHCEKRKPCGNRNCKVTSC